VRLIYGLVDKIKTASGVSDHIRTVLGGRLDCVLVTVLNRAI